MQPEWWNPMTGELMLRKERDGTYSDVATQAGRLALTATCGSLVAHAFGSEMAFWSMPG